uniref:C2H2-type domain-containing protein n=1 Tax=Globisporangium ultimum (strain ATCC 200006 / CBS 805.95 / DAOM BR144) TaxID=431595 RepID=K3WUX2_GLOUD
MDTNTLRVEHMKSHTGERPHICPVKTCAKSFSTSGNLSRHKRLHGYIEPLPCPVQGCVCTFPSNNKLEKHMKFHFANDVKLQSHRCRPVVNFGSSYQWIF